MAVAVVDVAGLGPGELLPVEVGTRKVLICRVDDAYYAIENRCPHAIVPLTRGRLSGCALECPFHGGMLDVRTGRALRAPIRRSVPTFRVRRVPGGLEIDTHVRPGED